MLENTQLSQKTSLENLSNLELAQALAERLAISHQDWHRLKGNRKAQAAQQLASAFVFLLKEQPDSALTHLNQAQGWLDRSLKAPPCPEHGTK
ncbi:hypothetical protein Xen7305DRAFT_00051060 [Xenococcus sp. PCC 7305]|uniref:DUF6439 family protein n=1 Tax=Xenococcus sp. PCC 7305 TaxID=102125 RepID=UPI0002AC2F0B|nr:DUF6439 family protein [Xenococcus sp. PCC 7305]ELS05363.1 hypothetical protein Xen7305DRAFT_00051060 [Xenococcus sp. PCC 7305]